MSCKDRKQQRKRKKTQKKNEKSADSDTLASRSAKGFASPPKPIYNKDGNIVYSKFDFCQSNSDSVDSKNKVAKKDYHKLLQKMEKRKEKEKSLESTDTKAAVAFKEKNQWKSALQKAEGVKVKDDAELIKKSVKRQQKMKQRSGKKWEERKERTEKMQQDKQDKRHANIKKRKETKTSKKIAKAKKKGRIVPGF